MRIRRQISCSLLRERPGRDRRCTTTVVLRLTSCDYLLSCLCDVVPVLCRYSDHRASTAEAAGLRRTGGPDGCERGVDGGRRGGVPPAPPAFVNGPLVPAIHGMNVLRPVLIRPLPIPLPPVPGECESSYWTRLAPAQPCPPGPAASPPTPAGAPSDQCRCPCILSGQSRHHLAHTISDLHAEGHLIPASHPGRSRSSLGVPPLRRRAHRLELPRPGLDFRSQ